MRTRLVLAVLPVALIGIVAAPSSAAPKTTKGSYTAAAIPDPSPNGTGTCNSTLPGGQQKDELKLPAAGKLTVNMSAFEGDWDLCLYVGDNLVASSAGFIEATKETVAYKAKKATTVTIGAANVGGGPTAAVDWTFTTLK